MELNTLRHHLYIYIYIYILSHEYPKAKTQHSQSTARLTNLVCTLPIKIQKPTRGERVCGIYRGLVRRRGIAFKSICVCGVWPLVGSQVGPTPLGPSALPSPAHAHPSPPSPRPSFPALPSLLPTTGPTLGDPLRVPYEAPPDTTHTDGFLRHAIPRLLTTPL